MKYHEWLNRRCVQLTLALLSALSITLTYTAMMPTPVAYALTNRPFCGLGSSATMTANKEPALAHPLTPQDPPNTPIGIFALDYSVNQPVAFTEDLSRLPTPIDTSKYSWTWSFGDGMKGTGFATTHAYKQPGTYVVRLALVDPTNHQNDDDNFDSADITIIPQAIANPPVAHVTASATYTTVGGSVTYDATGSHALDGSNLTYTWNFGDTTTATGPQVTHTFSILGQGFVALIVQDARGAKTVATAPVFVEVALPTGQLSVSATTARTGDTLSFDASGSQPIKTDPNDKIVSYQWDYGDGSQQTTTTPLTTHAYTQPGTYTVTMQAIDLHNYPGVFTVVLHIIAGGPLGLGSHGGLYIGGAITILVLVGLAVIGNWYRERQRQLALAARRRYRSRSSRR